LLSIATRKDTSETLPETSEAEQIQLAESTEFNFKNLWPRPCAVMDAREIGKKAEEPKEGF